MIVRLLPRKNNEGCDIIKVETCKKCHPFTLKMAVFASDEKLTFWDINRAEDNIFRLVNTALTYIKKNIRWRAEIGNVTREEIPEIPLKALREIVINSKAIGK